MRAAPGALSVVVVHDQGPTAVAARRRAVASGTRACRAPPAPVHAAVSPHGSAPAGRMPAGAESPNAPAGPWCQLREASPSFPVGGGRMTFAALAGSGW